MRHFARRPALSDRLIVRPRSSLHSFVRSLAHVSALVGSSGRSSAGPFARLSARALVQMNDKRPVNEQTSERVRLDERARVRSDDCKKTVRMIKADEHQEIATDRADEAHWSICALWPRSERVARLAQCVYVYVYVCVCVYVRLCVCLLELNSNQIQILLARRLPLCQLNTTKSIYRTRAAR